MELVERASADREAEFASSIAPSSDETKN